MLKVGNVEIKGKVVLAPMAGICNSAFRKIIKEMGASLIYAEMVSDKAIFFKNQKTKEMLFMEEIERPITQQIFGSDKETFVIAAKYIEKTMHPDIIDINMGCPVSKIIKCEAGAKWLLDPDKIYEMVSAVTDAVDKPVSVKMRIGWDDEHVFAVKNAQAAERAGVSAIAMHGRTRVQMYEGKANWDILKEVKESISVPFIGNGDVETPEDAERLLNYTGADGVMIGRAALGNPWMIYRTVEYLKSGKITAEPGIREKVDVCLLHFHRLMQLKGEKIAVLEMRNHTSWYLKNVRGNGKARNLINKAQTATELTMILNELVEEKEQEERETLLSSIESI